MGSIAAMLDRDRGGKARLNSAGQHCALAEEHF